MPVRDYKPTSGPIGPTHAPFPGKCKAEVHYYVGGWPKYKQCENKAKADGYCGTHNPEKVAAREKAVDEREQARFKAEVFASVFGRSGKTLAEALIKIRDGDNDPRQTAREALEAVNWEKYGA